MVKSHGCLFRIKLSFS